SRETAQAMREFITTMGAGNLDAGLNEIARENPDLAEKIRTTAGVAIKLEHGIALGKKAPKGWEGPAPAEPPPAAPAGGGTPP
ncbi:MAG: hypothetical protein Q8R35_03400, partial [bacterium]|nr:hypothetical protein [bacterium]